MWQQVLKEDGQLESKSEKIPPNTQVSLIFKEGRDANTKASVSSNILHTLTHRQPFPTFRETDEKHKPSWGTSDELRPGEAAFLITASPTDNSSL